MEDVNTPNLSGGLLAQLLGILYMFGGVLYCLTCFGAVFGVPWFLIGLALFRGGGHAKSFQTTGDVSDAMSTADELMRYVRIQAILAVVGLVIGVVVTALYLLLFVFVVLAEV